MSLNLQEFTFDNGLHVAKLSCFNIANFYPQTSLQISHQYFILGVDENLNIAVYTAPTNSYSGNFGPEYWVF